MTPDQAKDAELVLVGQSGASGEGSIRTTAAREPISVRGSRALRGTFMPAA